MRAFKKVTGIVAPLDRANIDTDQIIPKQFLKAVVRRGLGRGLFFDWRFRPDGAENPDFVLNQPRYRDAKILVAGENFGCGSSREHAVWALDDFGIQVVIAPSFADIFYNNCFKNGILPVTLPAGQVRSIMQAATAREGYQATVDLESQRVYDNSGWSVEFEIDAFRKHCLLNGLDDIALTLAHEDKIRAYEERHPLPWPRV